MLPPTTVPLIYPRTREREGGITRSESASACQAAGSPGWAGGRRRCEGEMLVSSWAGPMKSGSGKTDFSDLFLVLIIYLSRSILFAEL